jgi:error-prone DNA polymerase
VSYAELHLHSAYSFLDGASMPDEIVPVARELGHEVMALTDHNSLSGAMEFAQAARAHGLRALHGAEIDVVDAAGLAAGAPARHLTLLVRDATGWSNLCRLLTAAHSHTRRPGKSGWIGEPSVTLEQVAAHAEGLVCLSGCADHGVRDEPTMRFLLDAFGPDAFRVELQRPFARHDRARNRGLEALARRLGVPCVATGNVHAHMRERARLQDAFVAIREHTTLDASEPLRRGNHAHVLASPTAMAARFEDHPEAVLETARLAETLRFDLTQDLGYRYPYAEDDTADQRLAELCIAKREERYPHAHPLRAQAEARIDEELRVIRKLDLSGFFILHFELLELAREVAAEVRGGAMARSLLPPGRGRGSSVSSIICYLTGLSHVDPLENALALGRFLNEDLTALPDIDLDFPRDVRAVLIPRVHERYGHDKSALVAAFPTFKARGAIRELGKALGLPPGEIERVARGSEGWGAHGVDHDIAVALGEKRASEGRWRILAELSAQADGLPRHLSQHSGGMIVATRPLIDCCPVLPAAMEGRQMVQWDKDSCADAGFLKIDLLGLGMLSAVERTVELIARRRHETIDLSRIPFDDKPTYEAIQNAETTGVFQIESRAQMGSLRRTRPENLDDLTIQVAIVRPGPIVGGAVNPYIERKQRMRIDPDFVIPYDHPSLEPALRDTLGTIIFQDQVLEVAQAFAGFSAGQAESLRRAMSRKRSSAAIESHHADFVQGATTLHPDVDPAAAERVWQMVVGFSGFGFPKAHGAAFGLLAYQSTWLRVHYGPEFLCALLDEQPMGFYPPDGLVHEAQRRGIEILPPDVNASAAECTVTEAGAVRVGLGYVLGVKREEVAALVAERERSGPYRSIEDLAARAGAGRPALEQLAWAGACDRIVGEASPAAAADPAAATTPAAAGVACGRSVARRTALWQLGVARPAAPVGAHGTQLGLALDLPAAPSLKPLDDWESLVADYATTGMAIAHHPFALLRSHLARDGIVSSRDLDTLHHGAQVQLAGLVMARQKPATANGVCFMLLEDEFGTINLVVPPPVYERDRVTVRSEPLVVADGKLERYASAGGAINFVVRRLRPLEVPIAPLAEVRDLASRRPEPVSAVEPELASAAGAFRAVAPPVQSFARGRSR